MSETVFQPQTWPEFSRVPGTAKRIQRQAFLDHVRTKKGLSNRIYWPKELSETTIKGVVFRNVAFNHRTIRDCTFSACRFENCIFTGATFRHVEFHDCQFIACCFYKVRLEDVYGKPKQFKQAHTAREFPNVGVTFYHELRRNYFLTAQREHKNHAEFQYRVWMRRQNWSRAKDRRWFAKSVGWARRAFSWAYGFFFGYGYRVAALAATMTFMLLGAIATNHFLAPVTMNLENGSSVPATIYFTVTTMVTLGAAGYEPATDGGYWLVVGNAALGVALLTTTINAIFGRLSR